MAMPKANIEWNKIPASACVEDKRTHYVAHTGRKSAVVFWGSRDAKQAQATLWARSTDSKNQRACGDLFRKTRPLAGPSRRKRRK
jgi:hypothetical protein